MGRARDSLSSLRAGLVEGVVTERFVISDVYGSPPSKEEKVKVTAACRVHDGFRRRPVGGAVPNVYTSRWGDMAL